MQRPVDSVAFFKSHWMCWKILGVARQSATHGLPHRIYFFIMNTLITVAYPLHLFVTIFRNANQSDDVKNLAMTTTCAACSLKFFLFAANIKKVDKIENLLRRLDRRIETVDDHRIYQGLEKQVHYIFYVFFVIYITCAITAELSFIYQEERVLLYPAWFPFDWRNSDVKYFIANVYQIGGICYQLIQNFVSDCFPAVVLCLISGHIRLLGIRLARIGYDNKTLTENEKALERCIVDQQTLYSLFRTIESFMSLPMFIQFIVTTFNVCIAAAALLYSAKQPMDRLYFGFYFLAMPLQIFPTCYFATDNKIMFGKMHCAVFSSNWTVQGRKYKKDMMLLVERSLIETNAMAGGMLRVHVDTFFSTLKGAYSLFAVIMRIKN